MKYAYPYTTSEQIFGKKMTTEELLARVRTYSWKEAFIRLSLLSGLVANSPDGPLSEAVKVRTVDQIPKLSWQGPSTLGANSKEVVGAYRDGIVLAHDEVLSFLQHLVLLEGADDGDAPGDPEIALWLAGANSHLDPWVTENSSTEALMAEMIRISRFNDKPDALTELARTRLLFGTRPPQGELSAESKWTALEREAFGAGFAQFFESVLAPLYMFSQQWGIEDSKQERPLLHVPQFVADTKVSKMDLEGFIGPMTASRDELRTQIRKRLRPDGLPHAPISLLQRPLVEIAPEVFVAASPWAFRAQLRTGVWWRYLSAAKKLAPKGGADAWFSTFGYMVEHWCRRVAEEADPGSGPAGVLLPSMPGAPDEVEDVVVIEGNSAVLFSVKSRLVDARAGRDALSAAYTTGWFEDFFFEQRGDDYRGGAIRMLDGRIRKVRDGQFRHLGVDSAIKIYPVIVTFDSLGENDLFYRWLDERCKHHGLLQDPNVGPFALGRVQEFEQLMSRLAQGRSIVDLLHAREGDGRNRRLDQLIYEDGRPARLPFFEKEHWRLTADIKARLFVGAST